MNKIQAGRLLTLAYYLKTEVSKDKFYMRSYCSGNPSELLDNSCGTSACALGWASVVFPQRFSLFHGRLMLSAGLKYEIGYYGNTVCRYFGLSSDEASWLFGPFTRTPKEEARMIEKLVLEKGWCYDE